ncbi:MAG TPA: L-2-hydroxyglutarate oxidase [Thermoplasmata archaeon]|nr:L-2-hydroxyglutarate oxidase [Thermoplasmata archaeon]
MADRQDVVVIGGGIVGLATARAIRARRPDLSLALLEKESSVGTHQTGHNSGVVHSGVYYRPGSLKARLTLEGRTTLLAFAAKNAVPTRPIGKLIVAVGPRELPALDELLSRAHANGVESVRRLTREELQDRLPGVAGLGALHIPSASIIDYPALASRLAESLAKDGVALRTGHGLVSAAPAADGWRVATTDGEFEAGLVVNCAGLQADLVARAMGAQPPVSIVPFRGDFYRLSERLRSQVSCLVYPVPDPAVPFLGVHMTPTIGGELLAGPNAAIALSREGYRPGQWDLEELWRWASFRGTPGLARNYGALAAREWLRSWSPSAYLAAIQTVWPSATREDLGSRTSGVRAQAVRPDGTMEDDFVFVRGSRVLHVLNAPSPAATASFAIAERIADAAGLAGSAAS